MAALNPAWLKRFSLTVLEFFLPRLCLFCGAGVGEAAAQAVCPECEARIDWVASPRCAHLRPGVRGPRRQRPPLRRLPDGAAALCPGPGRGAL